MDKNNQQVDVELLDLAVEPAPLDYRELSAEELAAPQYNEAGCLSTVGCASSYTSCVATYSSAATFS